MADDLEEIRQRIIIEGADGALKELEKLGDEGAAAINKIKEAGSGDFAVGLRKASPEIAKLQDELAAAELAGRALPGTLGKAAVAARRLGNERGPTRVADDLDAAAQSSANLKNQIRTLSLSLRGLSRATGIHELSGLSRVLRGLGANVALIGPAVAALALTGLGALASSAAEATQVVQDLAFSAGQIPQIFQAVADAAIAVGGSAEKFGQALAKQPALIKATAQSERSLASANENVRDTMEKSADAADKLDDNLVNLAASQRKLNIETFSGASSAGAFAQKQADLFEQFRSNKITADQFHTSVDGLSAAQSKASLAALEQQRALDKQVRQANEAIIDQDIATRKAEKSARDAVRAQEENATALQKLNISATTFKGLDLDARMKLVAQQLAKMEPGFRRNAIALELFGADARKFITALDAAGGSFDRFIAEGERISPAFTKAQNAIGDRFTTAITKTAAVLTSLKDAFGIAVAPAFIDFFDRITDALVSIRPLLADFGKVLGSFLKPILDGIAASFQTIVVVINLVAAGFNALASILNTVFGTNLTGAQLFLALLVALGAAFFPVITGITLIVSAIGLLAEAIKLIDFKPVFSSFKAVALQVGTAITTFAKSVNDLFNGIGITISNSFNTAISFVTGLWDQFQSFLQSWVTSVIAFFQPLIDMIKKIAAFFASDQSSQTGNAGPGFAEGGGVRGAGTGTSDSILAWLSNGEFVMKMRAVRKYGLGFMHAINEGRLSLDSLRGFNLGGLVDSIMPMMPGPRAIPRFAEGGPAGGGLKPTRIVFDGSEFEAMMSQDTLDSLTKKSLQRRARRAGKRPSYIGG